MIQNLPCFKCHENTAILTYEETQIYQVSCHCGCNYEFEHSSMECAEEYHCKMVKLYREIDRADRLRQENEQLREQLKQFESLQTPQEANQYDCCPRCSTYLKDDNGVEGDYCPNCGQRIKWLNELVVEV